MSGTRKSFVERLFKEHRGAVQAFLYRRVSQRLDAAELAQEVYLRMLRVPDVASLRNPQAYLFAVASNLAHEHAQRAAREKGSLEIDDPRIQEQLSELPAFAGELDRAQRVKRLREVLDQLPVKCRATVMLHYWHGMRYEEIGERLEISPHMVKKYITQALVHCRRRMACLR